MGEASEWVSEGERTEHRAVTWFSNLWQLLPRVLVLASFSMILGTFFETDRIPLLTFSEGVCTFKSTVLNGYLPCTLPQDQKSNTVTGQI